MNTLFRFEKESFFKKLITFLVLLLIAYSIMLYVKFLLPATTISTIYNKDDEDVYVSVYIDKIFKVTQPKKVVKQKVVKKEKLYPLTALKLKAIYYSKDLKFVTLEDGKGSRFLDIGEVFKGYKLKDVFAKYAIFERNNKQYELRL